MKFTFIEEQLQLASNFANIFTSDNHSKLLETKKVQNSLQVLRSNDESADFTNKDFLLESLRLSENFLKYMMKTWLNLKWWIKPNINEFGMPGR